MKKTKAIIITLSIIIITQFQLLAFDIGSTKKLRNRVENASSEDWYLLAKSANKLIVKGRNLGEAKKWIMQSIEISERSYNLMLLGDYYQTIKYPEKALEYYVEALLVIDKYSLVSNADIQQRIAIIIWPNGY